MIKNIILLIFLIVFVNIDSEDKIIETLTKRLFNNNY